MSAQHRRGNHLYASIRDMLPEAVIYARDAMHETGVPASLLLALFQEAVDSVTTWKQYGKENKVILAIPPGEGYEGKTFNFAMKGYSMGHYTHTMVQYRSYDTWRESFMDTARYIVKVRPSVLKAKTADEACYSMRDFPTGNRHVRLDVLRIALKVFDLEKFDHI